MSVRAYRVVQATFAEPSFNVYQDRKLIDFIETKTETGFYACLNDYGSGEVDIPINVLQKAVRMAPKLDLGEETVKQLKGDIAAARANKDKSIIYSCF